MVASSATGRIRRGERAGDGPVGCCLFIPKDKPNSARREKGILFFLKRFGLFPFVRSEHNPTSTKNENEKYDNSTLKKINWPLTLGARGLPNPGHAGAGPFREC